MMTKILPWETWVNIFQGFKIPYDSRKEKTIFINYISNLELMQKYNSTPQHLSTNLLA